MRPTCKRFLFNRENKTEKSIKKFCVGTQQKMRDFYAISTVGVLEIHLLNLHDKRNVFSCKAIDHIQLLITTLCPTINNS